MISMKVMELVMERWGHCVSSMKTDIRSLYASVIALPPFQKKEKREQETDRPDRFNTQVAHKGVWYVIDYEAIREELEREEKVDSASEYLEKVNRIKKEKNR